MKITHHKDGTYSIMGMRRDDIDDLAFCAGIAHGWYLQHQGTIGTTDDWDRNRIEEFDRLGRVLSDVARWGGSLGPGVHLPAGRSVELDSTAWRGTAGRWAVVKDGRAPLPELEDAATD